MSSEHQVSPLRAGTVYSVQGSSREGFEFSTRAYCTQAGGGVVNLVGKTSEGHVLLIKGHPAREIFPSREGFSLGDNVPCSVHSRGSSEFSVYAPYTKKL